MSPVVGRILRKTCWVSVKMSQENYRQSLSELDWTKHNTHWSRGSVKQPSLDISLRGYQRCLSFNPSHFLCGHRLPTLPDTRVSIKESYPDYIPTDVSIKELTKRAKYHEIVIQAFWPRWQKEYLTHLTKRKHPIRQQLR